MHRWMFQNETFVKIKNANKKDLNRTLPKRETLKRRAGEETKPVPQIYGEECSSASTNLETAGQFPPYKKKPGQTFSLIASNTPTAGNSSTLTRKFTRVGCDHSVWCMDGTFKIVPEWYQQMFTIHMFAVKKENSLKSIFNANNI
ncbi:hypothetical protein T11_8668 [Trichinella zimbabwensis]|uniref:Uncharacterized protein n=1 Tax=Trichinella zimbabwensis TaxID=268475 RepID=A0A0V1HLZ0_9BILA|nr:hypothetical protein T11_8668 [Trichinella zimbabwensis]